jgi:dihydroxyacetone kinase phosphoprotein-dependent L subunit
VVTFQTAFDILDEGQTVSHAKANAVIRLSLQRALEIVEANETELNQLDAAAGDGDHGATMVRGLKAANQAVEQLQAEGKPGSLLVQAGSAFADAAGGASGALFGIFILTVGQKLETDLVDGAALYRALQAGLEAVCRLGKAKVGDKTIVDALEPFVKALGQAIAEGADLVDAWQQSLSASESGVAATSEMVARRGRSSRLGERSRGQMDPGAVSMFYLLQAAGEALTEVYGGNAPMV